MAGILGNNPLCNDHNTLRNISYYYPAGTVTYACGITVSYRSSVTPLNISWPAIPAFQTCCDKSGVGASVLRIPGNTGCEMQFCLLPGVTYPYTQTVVYPATATGDAPTTSVTTDSRTEPDDDVVSCMAAVSELDLPVDLRASVANVQAWQTVQKYDDELPEDQVEDAVTATAAPSGWVGTSATSTSSRPGAAATSSTRQDSSPGSSTASSSRGLLWNDGSDRTLLVAGCATGMALFLGYLVACI